MLRCAPIFGALFCACYTPPTAPATPSVWQVTGDGQTGVPGYRLPAKIVLRVTDADGRPIVGDTITFALSDPYATIETGSIPTQVDGAGLAQSIQSLPIVVTDTSGSAFVYWRLGATLGTQTLSARSGIPGVPAQTFTATSQSSLMQSIDGGDAGLCGVDATGRLGCWLPPRSNVPDLVAHAKLVDSPLHFTQLAMLGTALHWPGGTFPPANACALTDAGRVWCFRVDSMANATGLAELPGTYPALTQLFSGGYAGTTYCGLSAAGEAWCWGAANDFGQLGDGTTVPHTSPAAVATGARFAQLDIGDVTVCGVTTIGEAWCWGGNYDMQAGVPTNSRIVATPTLVDTPARFSSIRVLAVPDASCGFLNSGGMMCWGFLSPFGGQPATAVPMAINLPPAPIDIVENVNFNNFGDPVAYVLDRNASLRPVVPVFGSGYGVLPPQGLLKNLILAHGAGFICGTAALGGATLCLSNRFVFQGVDDVPAGGFLVRPPVVGVPFP
jgi:hypothetical protein